MTCSPNYFCRGKGLSITYPDLYLQSCLSSTKSAFAVFYCHLWPVWLYHICSHYLTQVTTFGNEFFNIKVCFISSSNFVWNTWRFIMSSVITNIYNKKTKGPTLRELFTVTRNLKKFFFWQLEMFDVCTAGDTAHSCVVRTWISYRCVPCHPWCTHRTSPVVHPQKKPSLVFLWLWTIPSR
jgi:hypothetical protein